MSGPPLILKNVTNANFRYAGLDVKYEPTKINLPANQKGYDTFETTVKKLSTRRIQIFGVYFC